MLTWKYDGGNLYFDESNILDNTQVAFGPNAVNRPDMVRKLREASQSALRNSNQRYEAVAIHVFRPSEPGPYQPQFSSAPVRDISSGLLGLLLCLERF